MEIRNIICGKCRLTLADRKVRFRYLEHEFFASVPCCPKCGYVYLSEELVTGKIGEVEETLEEK